MSVGEARSTRSQTKSYTVRTQTTTVSTQQQAALLASTGSPPSLRIPIAPSPNDDAPTARTLVSSRSTDDMQKSEEVPLLHRVQPKSPVKEEDVPLLKSVNAASNGRRRSLAPMTRLGAFAAVLHHLWRNYLWSLEHRPVWTKATTAAFISLLSELLAQWLSGAWSSTKCDSLLTCINWTSLRDQALIGFFIRGAPVHFWYLFLTWIFRNYDGSRQQHRLRSPQQQLRGKGSTDKPAAQGSVSEIETFKPVEPLWVVVAKVALDQLTYGPFSNWIYFYVIGFMEGRSLAAIRALVARDFLPIMIANWKLWPALAFINFKFVPKDLQVLFGNIISIFWTTYVVLNTRA